MGFHLSFTSCYEEEDVIWFSEAKFNGCYKMNQETKKAEFLFHFPEEEKEAVRLHGNVEKVGDWLVFSPTTGKNITLYHLVTKEVKSFSLKDMKGNYQVEYRKNAKFSRVLSFGQALYFIPITYPAIVKLDLETMSLTYFTPWRVALEAHIHEKQEAPFNIYFGGSMKTEKGFLFACTCTSCLLDFDVQEEQFQIKPLKTTAKSFQAIREVGEEIWLTPREGTIHTFWNPETGETRTEDIDIRENPEKMVFGTGIVPKEDDFLITCLVDGESRIFSYHPERGEIKPWNGLEKLLPQTRDLFYPFLPDFFFLPRKEDTLRFFSGRDHCLYTLNLKTQESLKVEIEADEVATEILSNRAVKNYENKSVTIAGFCQLIKNMPEKARKTEEETIGQTILDATT